MQNILFFDSDKSFKDFSKTCQLKDWRYVYFKESFNEISLKKIKPFLEAKIISVFTHSEKLSLKKLDLFKNLTLITTRTTGINHIDLDYCQKRNIKVSNVPQYGAITVAEFTFGLLLNLARKIIPANSDMIHNDIVMSAYTGFDLFGKTIGIIGTGSIGQHMIQIAKGFGMNILAYDLYQNPNLKEYYTPLDKLFEKSDIISLHIPSTPKNYHLLNKKAFNKMKKGVIILNTARGDLIDTPALYQAILNKRVAGVGLDVMENEDFLLHDEAIISSNLENKKFLLTSTINLKLLQLENVIVTPHIAFNSFDAIHRINAITCQNICSFLNGKAINLQSAH